MANEAYSIVGPYKVYKDKVTLDNNTIMATGESESKSFIRGYNLGMDHKSQQIKNALGC